MSWKQTLSAVAPTLATALGGPLAGAATSVIGKALMGDDFNGDIEAAVSGASTEQLLALKNADKQFAIESKKLDVENTNSARKLAVDTTIAPQVTLSVIYTVGYFWLMYLLMSGDIEINETIMPMMTALLGVMTAAQAQIMNFWFGSSSGSKQKTGKLK